MIRDIHIVQKFPGVPYSGVGSVEKKLNELVVDSQLERSSGHISFQPTDITLEPVPYKENYFNVRAWSETASEDYPGHILHDFSFTIEQGIKNKVLDNVLKVDYGRIYSLSQPEALFFLGLTFRALAAYKNAQRTDY